MNKYGTCLTKDEVIERFCKLSTEVRDAKFDDPCLASDCFCNLKGNCDPQYYRFDSEVIEFIEWCVKEILSQKDGGKCDRSS